MRDGGPALDLIRESEGLRLTAYEDCAGVLTIGYGHTGPDVQAGEMIDEHLAEVLLAQDAARAEKAVTRWVRVPLNENQRAALVDFVFNLGEGRFSQSTLLRKLNAKDYAAAADEFAKWRLAGGVVQPGLVARRARERALFLRPPGQP